MADTQLGLAVAGLCGFQLLNAWRQYAPSLEDVRNAPVNDPGMMRQLLDADVLVGGSAVVLGTSIAVLTGDKTALTLLLVMFGGISAWHHMVLNGEPAWRQ